MKKYYQQGDVLFFPCDEVKGKETKDGILVEGEASGHYHRVAVAEAKVYEENGVKYVQSSNPSGITVTHEEHNPVTLPPGKYRIGIVKEYDHFAEEAKNVMD